MLILKIKTGLYLRSLVHLQSNSNVYGLCRKIHTFCSLKQTKIFCSLKQKKISLFALFLQAKIYL